MTAISRAALYIKKIIKIAKSAPRTSHIVLKKKRRILSKMRQVPKRALERFWVSIYIIHVGQTQRGHFAQIFVNLWQSFVSQVARAQLHRHGGVRRVDLVAVAVCRRAHWEAACVGGVRGIRQVAAEVVAVGSRLRFEQLFGRQVFLLRADTRRLHVEDDFVEAEADVRAAVLLKLEERLRSHFALHDVVWSFVVLCLTAQEWRELGFAGPQRGRAATHDRNAVRICGAIFRCVHVFVFFKNFFFLKNGKKKSNVFLQVRSKCHFTPES